MNKRTRARWLSIILSVVMLANLFVGSVSAMPSLSETAEAPSDKAIAYLADQQQTDGGLSGFGGDSDVATSALGLVALGLAGVDPEYMSTDSTDISLLDFVVNNAITYTHEITGTSAANLFPGRAGLVLTGMASVYPTFDEMYTAEGFADAYSVISQLSSQLRQAYDSETGAYATDALEGWTSGAASISNQAWSILGLTSLTGSVPVTATNWLIDQQDVDGSFNYADPDTTALVGVALLMSGNVGADDAAIQAIVDYFQDTQLESGGWRPSWDTDALNADTTGWVLQFLLMAGHDPASPMWNGPYEALASLQGESGIIGGTYANVYSTVEALFGLYERPLTQITAQNLPTSIRPILAEMNTTGDDAGSWNGYSGTADVGSTCDAVMAIASTYVDPSTIGTVDHSPMDYLASQADTVATTGGASLVGKLAVTVKAAGLDTTSFGGQNLPEVLLNDWYSSTARAFLDEYGAVGDSWVQSYAILGMATITDTSTIPGAAIQTLENMQQDDGSWLDGWGYSPIDSTGLVLQALVAADGTPSVIADGVAYLKSVQESDGGWGNANSTSFAVLGLIAAGEDLHSSDWLVDGKGPIQALYSFAKGDGAFVWMWESEWSAPVDNLYALEQSVLALRGWVMPFTGASIPLMTAEQMNSSLKSALPDPDRLVIDGVDVPRSASGLDINVPFGSDLDEDATVSAELLPYGSTEWLSVGSLTRDTGVYSLHLSSLDAATASSVRVTVADPDTVQDKTDVGSSLVYTVTLEEYYLTIPWVTNYVTD